MTGPKRSWLSFFGLAPRYPVVRQYDRVDCGPACLLSVLRFHGGAPDWRPCARSLGRTRVELAFSVSTKPQGLSDSMREVQQGTTNLSEV